MRDSTSVDWRVACLSPVFYLHNIDIQRFEAIDLSINIQVHLKLSQMIVDATYSIWKYFEAIPALKKEKGINITGDYHCTLPYVWESTIKNYNLLSSCPV